MHVIREVSKDTLKLENIFAAARPGEFFSYEQLQVLSGVKMDTKGKNYMKSALNRLKLPYELLRGKGIKIVCKNNAMAIVADKVVRVDNAVKRAEKTTKRVRDKVYAELSDNERKQINFLGAMFGSIRAYSQGGKKIFGYKPLQVGEKVNK